MTNNQKSVTALVQQARRQNSMNVKALQAGYPSYEFNFVAERKNYMAKAREMKSNQNRAFAEFRAA